jgi:AcrR family transcriptional regulator
MGLREQNREQRRARVLCVSRKLIAEGGVEAISMRRLAQESGLAVNTIYALFGPTREHIFRALWDDGLVQLGRNLDESQETDPLKIGPNLVTAVAEFVIDNANIYRPVFLARMDSGAINDLSEFGLGASMGRKALQVAASAGSLRDDIDLDVLNEQILLAFTAFAQLWATGAIGDDEFRYRVLYGTHLSLCAVASDEARPQLNKALRKSARSLRKYRLKNSQEPRVQLKGD